MDVTEILGIAAGIVCTALVFLGGALVVVGTIVRKTSFGINLKALKCPDCGEAAPAVRMPANTRQTLWGGCTCPQCGCEYDKWGNPVQT
jgi:hypothetical protein